MPWIRIGIGASGRFAEAVGERLSALGAVAITYLDDGDSPLLEPDPGAMPDLDAWPAARVAGLFELDVDFPAVRSAFPDRRLDIEFLADEDWLNAWRRFSAVRKFGRLTIIPSERHATGVGHTDAPVRFSSSGQGSGAGHAMLAGQAPIVLRLDPGLAFGTGSHATTRLCLEWLAARDLRSRSMLDYGCGSGVLAIAAKLMGAERVVGVDHDPQALTATEANAARNEVCFAVEHSSEFLQREDRSGSVAEGAIQRFDIVMANILSGTLVKLAPRLSANVAPGGTLVLCGVLADQADEVVRAYPDFQFRGPKKLEEWVLLHGEHN